MFSDSYLDLDAPRDADDGLEDFEFFHERALAAATEQALQEKMLNDAYCLESLHLRPDEDIFGTSMLFTQASGYIQHDQHLSEACLVYEPSTPIPRPPKDFWAALPPGAMSSNALRLGLPVELEAQQVAVACVAPKESFPPPSSASVEQGKIELITPEHTPQLEDLGLEASNIPGSLQEYISSPSTPSCPSLLPFRSPAYTSTPGASPTSSPSTPCDSASSPLVTVKDEDGTDDVINTDHAASLARMYISPKTRPRSKREGKQRARASPYPTPSTPASSTPSSPAKGARSGGISSPRRNCDADFTAVIATILALRAAPPASPYECPYCTEPNKDPKQFTAKPDYVRHLRTHLPLDGAWACGVPLRLAAKYDLPPVRAAGASVHMYYGEEMVGGCGSVFSRKDALERHQKSHPQCKSDAGGDWHVGAIINTALGLKRKTKGEGKKTGKARA